ncbi:MAG: hypothetical protein WA782_11505 [Sulfitobacter sp.]
MMGVVLWSDVNDEKAVFWCEDHGDLAYFNAAVVLGSTDRLFQPGDMVQFDVTIERKTRRAHNARIVESKVCNSLLHSLRKSIAKDDTPSAIPSPTGKVIPFRQSTNFDAPLRRCENG